MATAELDKVEIRNVGAIEEFTMPYLPGGGIVKIKGSKGKGKSTALASVTAAVSGKGKLPLRDLAAKGEVKGFGTTIKLGARTTRSGEPVVEGLESRFDVASIVDPGIIDPIAADAKRIKALVQLAGGEPDANLFLPLFGGDEKLFAAIVDESVGELPDLVAMADRVKRDCEKEAREEERMADVEAGVIAALKQATEGVDMDAESDIAKLGAAYEAAIREESRIKAVHAAYMASMKAVGKATAQLEQLNAGRTLPSMQEADQRLKDAEAKCYELDAEITALEQVLAKAKADHHFSGIERNMAASMCQSVAEFDGMIAKCREVVEAGVTSEPVGSEHLEQAAKNVAAAREAQEKGVAIRKARENVAKLKAAQGEQQKHANAASTLRKVAQSTDAILSAEVAKLGTPLRVEQSRLVTDTGRGPTFYGELSPGERSYMAYEIASACAGEHAVFSIPQNVWGEVQPADEQKLNALFKSRKQCVYTAEITDDEELIAEVL